MFSINKLSSVGITEYGLKWIGDRIRSFRNDRGISIQMLSDLTTVQYSVIEMAERGMAILEPSEMSHIASALRIDLGHLVGYEGFYMNNISMTELNKIKGSSRSKLLGTTKLFKERSLKVAKEIKRVMKLYKYTVNELSKACVLDSRRLSHCLAGKLVFHNDEVEKIGAELRIDLFNLS